jgi:hypothetical protein
MLVAGTWHDRVVLAPELLNNPGEQQFVAARAADLTVTLPRQDAPSDPIEIAPDNRAVTAAVPVTGTTRPPRSRTQRSRLELWYATAKRQSTPGSMHSGLDHRPAVWVPAANQDGGG